MIRVSLSEGSEPVLMDRVLRTGQDVQGSYQVVCLLVLVLEEEVGEKELQRETRSEEERKKGFVSPGSPGGTTQWTVLLLTSSYI